tara:strand:- start:25 stop:828 length:804 start_codon:yes stop_codon:yes gene_type:complete
MLGLGNSVTASQYNYGSAAWTPETLDNLQLWLAFNQNITSDADASNSSHTHSTTAGNMADADRINAWNAFGSTSINAVQTTFADKPLWETDVADIGGVNFPTPAKIMDLSSNVVLDANTDFTIAVRFKCSDFDSARGLMGSASNEFLRLNNNTLLRVKINGTNRDFALASGNIATDEYFTLLIVRSDDSTGNINVFIRGDQSLNGTATGTQMGSQLADAGEITISDIGVTHDEGGNFKGVLKDVLIWDGTAASSGDREEIFDYIEGQ